MTVHGRDAADAARLRPALRPPAAPGAPPAALPAGLGADEASRRLARDGPNELAHAPPRDLPRILLEVVREPMFLLLIAAAALYALLGDLGEAAILCASVVVVVALTIYQEDKSERALRALRDLASPRAAVVRDGALVRIPAREVVVGDVVMIAEGDRVPADARALSAYDLRVDESILTGESAAASKFAANGAAAPQAETADAADASMLYSSTLVVGGHAFAEVVATGARTAVGRIGRALAGILTERSPLQREIAHVVVVFAVAGLVLCALVVGLSLLRGSGWIDALLAGITLAIANVPEEFPVVLGVFVAMGAWRLARHRVLTRKAAAIETLGAVTVLCTDKTGTLTENRMVVRALCAGGRRWMRAAGAGGADLPAPFRELLRFAALASEIAPFDPMEKAIVALAGDAVPETLAAMPAWPLVREYPLTRELLAHTHVWRTAAGGLVVACKGAPEAVAALCALDADARTALLTEAALLAGDALHMIAFAAADAPAGAADAAALPDSPRGFRFRLLGLIGLEDPLREGVRSAVQDAAAAGVRTVMLTGDYPATAAAIARRAGFGAAGDVVAGDALETMDAAALQAVAGTAEVFARMRPEQKLRLVEAFKRNGDVVAMTGDGVNDATALKAAHVGIAMGVRGADVARESAALVLLDDDFVSIVRAIRLGRTICDNIVRALRFVLAVHVPVAGVALLPLLLGGPLVLWPIHIVFLELVIDPACSIVFEQEPAEADVMHRPPRPARRPLLDARTILASLLVGAAALVAVGAVYLAAWQAGRPAGEIAALAFAAIVAANLGLIAINRTGGAWPVRGRPSNRALRYVTGFALAALAASLYAPPLRTLFRFETPPPAWLLAAVALPLAVLLAIDGAVRALRGRRAARRARERDQPRRGEA